MTSVTPENVPPKITLRHVSSRNDLKNFVCGNREIDTWAKSKAHKLHDRGRVSVTVACADGSNSPCGFYSLTHNVAETSKLLRREDRDVWDKAPKEDGPTPLMILPIWTIADLFGG
jgi:hypothetical protein